MTEEATMLGAPEVPEKTEDAAWYLMDGVPGTGERPDYLEPKYKTLAEQAKAYKEARKALGALSGAPENYTLEEYKELINPENAHIKDFMGYAKTNRFSQDAVNEIMKTFVGYQKSFTPNLDEEKAKLGPDADKRLDVINQWASNHFSEKSMETLGKISTHAEVVELMDELRNIHMNSSSKAPTHVDTEASYKPMTRDTVRNEMMANYPKYLADANYRAEITRKFSQVIEE